MRARSPAVAVLLLAGISLRAAAEPVPLADCAEPNGYSYYLQGGSVGQDMQGWHPDGMRGGRIRLSADGSNIVVSTIDAAGVTTAFDQSRTQSLVSDQTAGGITALLTAPDPAHRTVDTFLIKLDRQRMGTVVWTFADIGPSATKSTTLSASCLPAR